MNHVTTKNDKTQHEFDLMSTTFPINALSDHSIVNIGRGNIIVTASTARWKQIVNYIQWLASPGLHSLR